MPGEISLQADVGALSLQGLGGWTKWLNVLTADDVAPKAQVEMKALGGLFHTSGRFAEKVKTELQRCPSVRQDRIALELGWRKGDSPSIMADSAGGQAIALLSLCMMETLGGQKSNVGLVMSQLCKEFLGGDMNVCPVPRLADFADMLAGKLSCLGFGDFLVEQETKLVQCFCNMEKDIPSDLMNGLDVRSIENLLRLIAKAFQKEDKICRIRGSASMGWILTLLLAMFPRNTTITVGGVNLQQAENLKVYCEIVDSWKSPSTEVFLQNPASHFDRNAWIGKLHVLEPLPIPASSFTHFRWGGWLANNLRLILLNYNIVADYQFIQAVCDLLVLIPGALSLLPTISAAKARRESLRSASLLDLLGPMPGARMATICQEILGCTPSATQMSLEQAAIIFEASVSALLKGYRCSCDKPSHCEWQSFKIFLEFPHIVNVKCTTWRIWRDITAKLSQGVWSFFINAGPNTTICDAALENDIPSHIIGALTRNVDSSMISVDSLMSSVMHLAVGRQIDQHEVFASSERSTVFPSVLESLAVPRHQLATFELVDGRLIYEGGYHRSIAAEVPSETRPKARKPLAGEMKPSHTGRADENPGMNGILIRKTASDLAVSFDIYYGGFTTHLNLKSVLIGYLGMRWTEPCPHRVTDTMDVTRRKAISTSVTAPSAFGKLGVAMTRGSPSSQFMCCEDGHQAVLQTRSCLNCAAEPYPDQNAVVIIVT